MNIIAIAVGICLILCLAKSRVLKEFYRYILAFGMYATLFLRIGVFFDLFQMDIRFYEVFFYIAFLTAVLLLVKNGIKRKQFQALIYLFLILLVNNLLLYLFPYTEEIITWTLSWDRDYYSNHFALVHFSRRTLQLDITIVMFVTIVYTAMKNFDMEDVKKTLGLFVKLGATVYFFVVVEMVFKNLISSDIYYKILNFSFGVVGDPIETISRYGFNPIFGFCVEPQHFAKGLFIWMLAALVTLKGKTKWSAIAAYTLTSILTTSFAAILYIGLIAILVLYESKHRLRILLTYFCFTLILASVFFARNPRILHNFMLRFQNLFYMAFNRENVLAASEATRITSIIETFRYFLNRPIWGIGIGTTYAHGAVTSLLSNIGIMGVVFWTFLTRISVEKKQWLNKQRAILAIYLIAMFFTTTYWLAFFSLEYLLLIFVLKAGNDSWVGSYK